MMNLLVILVVGACLLAFGPHAFGSEQRRSGDWAVDVSNQGVRIAITENASGAGFGVFCIVRADGCQAFVTLSDVKCKKGDTLPMMLNAPTGATNLEGTCDTIGADRPLHILILNDFSAAMSAIESGGEVGFAIPLASGKFQIMRFSTVGAVPAVREARTRSREPEVSPARGSARNQIL